MDQVLNNELKDVWKITPWSRVKETTIQKETNKKKTIFIREEQVIPKNQVIFTNHIFFVEQGKNTLVIRPKTRKIYIRKVRGQTRTLEFHKGAVDIIVPRDIMDKPEWFKKTYLEPSKKQSTQSRFIKAIWEYRDNIFMEKKPSERLS